MRYAQYGNVFIELTIVSTIRNNQITEKEEAAHV
jgi:hypothetical protein